MRWPKITEKPKVIIVPSERYNEFINRLEAKNIVDMIARSLRTKLKPEFQVNTNVGKKTH